MHVSRRLAPLLAVTVLVALGPLAGPAGATTVSASGRAYDFGPGGGIPPGAVVSVREAPALSSPLADDLTWQIDGLAPGSVVSFVLEAPGRIPVQTARLTVPDDGLTDVTFQTPGPKMVDLLAQIVGEAPEPAHCQVASTVTRRGHELGTGPGTHGEPGATVSISPAVAPTAGPIYFNLSSPEVIWPDRALRSTTADGGVLFVNLAPGTYTLRAHKAGATIRPLQVECRAGVLTNGAPPDGLQVTAGGLDPDESPEVPPPSVPPTEATAPPAPTDPAPVGVAVAPTPPALARADEARFAG